PRQASNSQVTVCYLARRSAAAGPADWVAAGGPPVAACAAGSVDRAADPPPSADDPVDLEALGEVAVHVHPVRSRDVPDVVRVGVAAMLLRRVARERRHLALDVPLLEGDVGLVGEVEVVPRDLVAEDRRPLERPQTLGGDHLVVLVDVVQARLEDDVRPQLLPQLDEELEDVLPVLRERPHLEVVHGQARLRDADLRRRLAHLAGERVRREAIGQRLGRDREGHVAHVFARLDEPGHRPAAAELAVVRVRRENERALPAVDHAGSSPQRAVATQAARPSAPQPIGSSNSASYPRLCTAIASSVSPTPSGTTPLAVAAARRKASARPASARQANSASPTIPVSAATVTGVVCKAERLRPAAPASPARFAYARSKPPMPTPCSGWSSAMRMPRVTSLPRPLVASASTAGAAGKAGARAGRAASRQAARSAAAADTAAGRGRKATAAAASTPTISAAKLDCE